MSTDRANASLNDALSVELRRIEAAYAKRASQIRYSYSDPAHLLTCQDRERKLLRILADRGHSSLANATILEVGCGNGAWLRDFVRWGARPENLWGVDLLSARIAEAKMLCPPEVNLQCQDATHLNMPDASFDVVLQATVFTSILDQGVKHLLAQEMLRVVRNNGLILWYDFHMNNPANPDVCGVNREEIRELFPGCEVSLKKLTLAPPVGRPVARVSASLWRALSGIKPLCTHYLGTISKI